MELEKIEQIMQLMNKYQVCKLEVQSEHDRIKLQSALYQNQEKTQLIGSQVSAPPPHQQVATVVNTVEALQTGKRHEVRSPFVGIYYEAPSPGAKPFVQIGSRVKKGQTLCIVEAMKLMNEIEAEQEGLLVEILLKNEEPVEFDQIIFVIT